MAEQADSSKTYKGTVLVSMMMEIELGETESDSPESAQSFFEQEAQKLMGECGRMELVRHSSHCGLEVLQVRTDKV